MPGLWCHDSIFVGRLRRERRTCDHSFLWFCSWSVTAKNLETLLQPPPRGNYTQSPQPHNYPGVLVLAHQTSNPLWAASLVLRSERPGIRGPFGRGWKRGISDALFGDLLGCSGRVGSLVIQIEYYRNLIKKPWVFIRVLNVKPYIVGVIMGPGFLNQVPTLARSIFLNMSYVQPDA